MEPLFRSKISFQFSKDNEESPPLDDLSMCVKSPLFSDLQVYDKKLSPFRKTLTLYQLKFNLNDLVQYTNPSVTESVTIFADTVYMTEELEIFYNLTIRARIVAISYPITLVYDRNLNLRTFPREMLVRHVSFEDKLDMRQRKFGLIDIMDQHGYVPEEYERYCHNSAYSLSNGLDLHDWFDLNIVNMLHICSQSLLADKKSKPIALKIIDFVQKFYQKRTDVKDPSAYFAAQRFLKLKQKEQNVTIHYVPKFVLSQIKELSKTLYTHLHLYWTTVKDHESNVTDLAANLQNSNQQYELAEQQLTNLILSEKRIFLNSINQANTTMFIGYDHR